MKEYKVVDLSYSQDARQHLKDVAAYHELDGWRLLSVVHLPDSRRWLYYLERDAPAGSGPRGGVAAAAAGSERGLARPVRRVGGGRPGDAAAAGADVLKDAVIVEVGSRPDEGTAPEPPEGLGPIEYRARQPCECRVPKGERRFRQDPVLEPQCVPCWARGHVEQVTSGGAGPS